MTRAENSRRHADRPAAHASRRTSPIDRPPGIWPAALLATLTVLACMARPGFAGAPPFPATAAAAPAAQPVVDPAIPGANLPPRGRSLFDQLFVVSQGGRAEIGLPFPFSALLARLDAQVQRDPASPLPPAKRVLIPLGRSLQRTAAAPDHFAFPRVVVAVDSPPASASAPLLKDRLYIGYQEKSAVLEVISYNEDAGRFEFQLVKDYRAGGRPRVYYANRTLCFACHQNGAPIFARALWDETNANRRVAAQLLASRRDFYGIAVERGVDVPYAIDNASERANRFALTQHLWQAGCGGADTAGQRCRAGLFAAALRHALADGQSWTPNADFNETVARPLRAEVERRSPGGLAIGNPDLPNRNPLQGVSQWPAERAARVALSHVAADFDPLLPRPPREIWQPAAPDALRQLVAGLAEFIAAPDRQHLAEHIERAAGATLSQVELACRSEVQAGAPGWSLSCAGANGAALEARLLRRAGRPMSGEVTRLTLAGGTALNDLALTSAARSGPRRAGASAALPASLRLRVTSRSQHERGRFARTAAGDAIVALDIARRAGNGGESIDTGRPFAATLHVRHDFALVQQAIDRLARAPATSALLAPMPFPRQRLFAALFGQLGAAVPPSCCLAAEALPPPRLEVPATPPGAGATPAAADVAEHGFRPYCAACHQSAETFPPNFLQGSADEVERKLRHCAPRLYVRLAMADVAPERRAKTPMPPESVLPAFATEARAWRSSPVRKALLAQVDEWLRAESGHAAQLEPLLAGGYEALRPCLPPH